MGTKEGISRSKGFICCSIKCWSNVWNPSLIIWLICRMKVHVIVQNSFLVLLTLSSFSTTSPGPTPTLRPSRSGRQRRHRPYLRRACLRDLLFSAAFLRRQRTSFMKAVCVTCGRISRWATWHGRPRRAITVQDLGWGGGYRKHSLSNQSTVSLLFYFEDFTNLHFMITSLFDIRFKGTYLRESRYWTVVFILDESWEFSFGL